MVMESGTNATPGLDFVNGKVRSYSVRQMITRASKEMGDFTFVI